MAVINCPECGKEKSDQAKVCPHCGFKEKKEFNFDFQILKDNKGLMISSSVICILLIGMFIFLIIDNLPNDKKANAIISSSSSSNAYNNVSSNTESTNNSYNIVNYMADKSVDYYSAEKLHRLFFSFKTSEDGERIKGAATVSVTITDDNNKELYKNTINVTSDSFKEWTSKINGTRLLCSIDILDSELKTAGTSSGKLVFTVTGDNFTFKPSPINIFNLSYVDTTKEIKSISLDKTAETVKVGKYVILNANILPNTAYSSDITWTSSNPLVAKVNKSGWVDAITSGTAIITAKAPNGVNASCTITVPAANSSTCSLTIPTLPVKLSYSSSLGSKIYTTVNVSGITYEFSDHNYDDKVQLKIVFSGEKLYDYQGANQSSNCTISYKLYKNSVVVDSGTNYTTSVAVGESFNSTETVYSLDAGNYELQLLSTN